MEAVADYGRRYLRAHPHAGAAELDEALRRKFGLLTGPPEPPSPAPHVNEGVVAEQAWYTIRFWWWFVRDRFFPRRPSVTAEEVARVVAMLLPPSAEPGTADVLGT